MRNLSAVRARIVGLALTVIALVSLGLPSAVEATSDDGYARDAPSSIRAAAGDDVWECLGDWVDPSDSRFLDMAELSFWATPDRGQLCFEFLLYYPCVTTELTLDKGGLLRVFLDTDGLLSTGMDIGEGIGTDFLLEFVYSGSGTYTMEIWAIPGDDPYDWTFVGEVPAYTGETEDGFIFLGAEFAASTVGNPSRAGLTAYSLWKSPIGEEFDDSLPDDGHEEVIIRSPAGPGVSFADVPAGHSYAAAIRTLAEAGIINGYADNTFGPGNPVWRQHFAKMITLTLDLPVSESDSCHFSDVPFSGAGDLYPDNYIAVCVARGITLGKTPTTFAPEANITRAQLVTMVVRALSTARPGLLQNPPSWYGGTWGNFSRDHQDSARKAEFNGLLAGLPLAGLGPWGAMPRGEVAQVLSNVLALMDEVVVTPAPHPDSSTGIVTSVTDGDTIRVRIGGQEKTVRLIGINTPESGEPFATQATSALRSLVQGKTVRLEQDVTTTDQYGRLLAYVWIGSTMANAELLRQGLAQLYTLPPNVKYTSMLQAALGEAQAAGRGMWADAPMGSPIEVVSIHENAAGNDNFNLNDEYVTFRVLVSGSLVGYVVKDKTSVASHRYRFPDRVFQASQVFRLRTGTGADTQTDLYWGMTTSAIWNNEGDTVYVLDPQGHVVESYSY